MLLFDVMTAPFIFFYSGIWWTASLTYFHHYEYVTLLVYVQTVWKVTADFAIGLSLSCLWVMARLYI